MPTYAECGGLMYLCEQIVDFQGKFWQTVGIFPASAVMSSQLVLGYRQATTLQDTPLLETGAKITGHEFHRSYLTQAPLNPLFEIRGYSSSSLPTKEGWCKQQVHASYLHLHFGDRSEIVDRFLQHCSKLAISRN